MHRFDARQDDVGAPEILEAHHGPGSAFDSPMILLHDVVQILDLPDLDGHFAFSVDGLEGGQISPAFIHGYGLRRAVPINGFLKVTAGRTLVTMGPKQEIDGLAGLVHSAIQVLI
jgi:hypothetical protein